MENAMHLLSVTNLSFSWGYKSLLTKVSFNLDAGQTIGIAGPNGAGKSTLINIIRGISAADEGTISCAPQATMALVSQEPDFGCALTVRDYLLSTILPLADTMRQLEEALAHTEEAGLPKILGEFGMAQEAFLAAGGYAAETQAANLLSRTGLAISLPSSTDRRAARFGWRTGTRRRSGAPAVWRRTAAGPGRPGPGDRSCAAALRRAAAVFGPQPSAGRGGADR